MLTRVTTHFSLRLFSHGWDVLEPSYWRNRSEESVFWTLYRNDRDGAYISAGGTTLPLMAGENYLIPPGCRYDYWCDQDVGHLWIYFDVLGLSPMVIKVLFPEPIALSLSPFAADSLNRIAAHPQTVISLDAQWRSMAAITEGMLLAIESLPPERLVGMRHLIYDEAPVTAALQHIEANLAERLPNQELAACCSMSEDYFIRKFRETVGRTPAQYVLEARVRAAAQLLLFSDLSLEGIASRVGFGSRQYFSRAFACQMGIGPASYRKTRRDSRYSKQ